MPDAISLHDAAMEKAEEAVDARRRHETDVAVALFTLAFSLERDAALAVPEDLEPSRSVLLRSAASLALECGELREAERLVARALSGSPPDELIEELRELLQRANFARHLELRGITLQPDEFQLSIAGDAVGLGIADSDEFVRRVDFFEKLVYRTAERTLGRDYRDRGRRKRHLEDDVRLYVSTPRAASFAVTLRVGSSPQQSFPGASLGEAVVDEILTCLDLLNQTKIDTLRDHIGNESYYRNFVELARSIAPDGEDVKVVGFTATREGKERSVLFSIPSRNVPLAVVRPSTARPVEMRGTLKIVLGSVDIIDRRGQQHRLQVPAGMMSDIVRPMHEEEVVVTAHEEAGKMVLDRIEPAEANSTDFPI